MSNKNQYFCLIITSVVLITISLSSIKYSNSYASPLIHSAGNDNEESGFIYGYIDTSRAYDPLLLENDVSMNIARHHLEGLYTSEFDAEGNNIIVPQLAASFGIWNADLTELTVELRDDVNWQNGNPFVADDVIWNWDRIKYHYDNRLLENQSIWENDIGSFAIDSVEKLAEHSVKFTLVQKFDKFEQVLAHPSTALIYPDDAYLQTSIKEEQIDQLIGTGPFILEKYDSDYQTTLLSRFVDYWRGGADIQLLYFQHYPQQENLTNSLLNENIHMCDGISKEIVESHQEDPNIAFIEAKENIMGYYSQKADNVEYLAYTYPFRYFYPIDLHEGLSPVKPNLADPFKDLWENIPGFRVNFILISSSIFVFYKLSRSKITKS